MSEIKELSKEQLIERLNESQELIGALTEGFISLVLFTNSYSEVSELSEEESLILPCHDDANRYVLDVSVNEDEKRKFLKMKVDLLPEGSTRMH